MEPGEYELPPLTDAERKEFEAWKGRFDVGAAVELFEERAAVMEYDAGLSREEAEVRALIDIIGGE